MNLTRRNFVFILCYVSLIEFVESCLNANIEIGGEKRRPRCGDIYNQASGTLFYKPLEEVLDHERCVWIISVPQALGYSVNVKFLSAPTNQPNTGHGLVLTGIAWNDTEPPIVKNYMPTSIGAFNISDSNIVIVTFLTSERVSDGSGTGIVFDYEALYAGNATAISVSSKHHLVETPTINLNYPESTVAPYSPRELTAFVFLLVNQINNRRQQQDLQFYMKELEGNTCNDSVFIYKLNSSSLNTGKIWDESIRYCGDTARYRVTLSHDDTILGIFQSNSANTNYIGFDFNYFAC